MTNEKPIVTVFDAHSNSQSNREMTVEEHAQYLEDIANASAPLVVEPLQD